MTWEQGINFRLIHNYVTDDAVEDNENGEQVPEGSNNYPHTSAQGNSIGWETTKGAISQADRTTGQDRRLAGVNYPPEGSPRDYRIDLPSPGDYEVRIAIGDYSSASTACKAELFDGTTSLGVLCNGSASGPNVFYDATGVERTAAAWPGSNLAVTKTFATTILRLKVGVTTAAATPIAHLNVKAASAAPPPPPTTDYGPTSDGTNNGWTNDADGTTLYASIDEVTPSDSDYIKSPDNPVIGQTCILFFDDLDTPEEGSVQKISYRICAAGSVGVRIQLRAADDTQVHEWYHAAGTYGTYPDFQLFEHSDLTSGELATWAAGGYPGSYLMLIPGAT